MSFFCLLSSYGILALVEALYSSLSQYVMNQMVDSHLKVTMFSIYLMIMNMIDIFTNVSFGIAGNQKIQWVMLLGAFFCLVSLICQWLFERRKNEWK